MRHAAILKLREDLSKDKHMRMDAGDFLQELGAIMIKADIYIMENDRQEKSIVPILKQLRMEANMTFQQCLMSPIQKSSRMICSGTGMYFLRICVKSTSC